ncbi:MAG: GNAT family N-acetyltransferase [Planctomycetales bacterium]|nr:GNAT family N-acetyltransferase [Planctomycetales bacterium]
MMDDQLLTVVPASNEALAPATELVFQHLPEGERAALLQTLLQIAAHDSDPFAGLLVARRGGVLVGAVWAQIQPGNVSVLWPANVMSEEPKSTLDRLMVEAVKFLEAAGVTMAQTVVEDKTSTDIEVLYRAGFSHFADLHYMACTPVSFPSIRPSSDFEHLVFTPVLEDRFRRVVERTYEATLDCPALNGVRPIAEVFEGYRATGTFLPENWRLIVDKQRDVGCLLLADHPGADKLELVYMGVVPEARGRRLGRELTVYAQWLARCAGRSRLVLAVDTKNQPAIDVYLSLGFFAWDRRSVFLRTFG